ncbi:aggregation-promoting factor [Loigolactobacillus zhaoyuanensis]|uniref:LysM peptidoglycan-binding domain-containing protein n=1 Tax=Loigolactobacillus zhaoyuanensis TaxID=2486017 RepID=A0ABW8UF91_9LACO|nr:LysM peptidoglycan-binding domain-containing protein [Loigolactobacillus zhaoyuanensis]
MLVLSTVGAASLFVGGVAQASAATVTAQAGDTVAELSNANGVSITAFEQANGINSSTHLIYAGQTYTLPGTTQTTTTTVAAQPAATQTQAAQQTTQTTQAATTASTTTAAATTSGSSSDEAAKAWIANKESGGSYTATNGQYIGKYQLSSSYLNGDYSAANQETVANNYVTSRYGSWTAAQSFWQANGWY